MTKRSGDFPESVKRKLKDRVSSRCSNPDCRVPTESPSDESVSRVNSEGIAAHICAASPKGPRYSPKMTKEERGSIENGIWLCSNCSIKIDRDVKTYSVDLLKDWKRQAEQSAKQEQGQKLPNKNDAINTLTSAFGGYSKNFIPTAISNVHGASENALEALDSRFKIESSYINKITQLQIHAKETVPFSINIEDRYKNEYFEKIQKLFEHGEDLEIDMEAINLKGSPLLEEIPKIINKGNMHIFPKKKKCIQKFWVINKLTLKEEFFDLSHGVIAYGQKLFNVIVNACDELLEIKYKINLKLEETDLIITSFQDLTMSIKFERWENCDVRYLPYFDKLYLFFKQLFDGWELKTSLEINGLVIYDAIIVTGRAMKSINATFQYINYVKILSKYLNIQIKYIYDHSYTEKDYYDLVEIIDIIEGEYILNKNNFSSISITVTIDNTLACNQLLQDSNKPINTMFIPNTQDEITLFNQVIRLPKKKFILTSVLPKIDKPISEIQEGDLVKVEFLPCDNFELKIEFVSDENIC